MENYKWQHEYDAIFLHWCIGYPTEEKAIKFLKEAKSKLKGNKYGKDGIFCGNSYIFLLDNLRDEDERLKSEKGQTIRNQEELETMFDKAGLTIRRRHGPFKVHERLGE